MPANIALIKYMGKSSNNQPLNGSLSYTCSRFTATVSLSESTRNHWAPNHLSPHAQNRFLEHLDRLRSINEDTRCFRIESTTHFPSHCGLASSAASFAALTEAYCNSLGTVIDVQKRAAWSRMGSGSSCRSFLAPWVQWDQNGISAATIPYRIHHCVIVIDPAPKKISSSLAHRRVNALTDIDQRVVRANQRLQKLTQLFHMKQWQQAAALCWDEFHDMHQLFEHCTPAFRYINEPTTQTLATLEKTNQKEGDSPIITLDAGPNIHLLFREDQDPKIWLNSIKYRILE